MDAFLMVALHIIKEDLYLQDHTCGYSIYLETAGQKPMKKFLLFICIFVLFSPVSSLQSGENKITQALSQDVIRRIREKYIPMYQKYQGVESNREVEIKTYDSETNTLIKTANVHLLRKDYFYKKPEVKVLKYVVDGKEEAPSKYKPLEYQPGYQVFDENGDKNYETRVIGYKTIDGYPCYEVNVLPKKATKLHYKGKLYYRVSDLALIKSSGSIGEISFPLKGFHMDLYTEELNDLTVVSSGIITANVDLPVFLPNRRIVSRFKVLYNKPIL